MRTPNFLALLTDIKIKYLIKCLQVDWEYIKNNFTPTQCDALLELGHLNKEQHQLLRPDLAEKSGGIILLFNTSITSLIGGWLGLASIVGFNKSSPWVIIVIIAATSLGFLLGYYSYRMTKENARKSIHTQKLLNA